MSNGNGTYVGSERRINGGDRREHHCLHEGDFGMLKTTVNNLNDKIEHHIKDQKERNTTIFNKFDRITSCLTQVSAAQEMLPNKVASLLEDKKEKKLANQSTMLKNISTTIAILAALGTAVFWIVNFIQSNPIITP